MLRHPTLPGQVAACCQEGLPQGCSRARGWGALRCVFYCSQANRGRQPLREYRALPGPCLRARSTREEKFREVQGRGERHGLGRPVGQTAGSHGGAQRGWAGYQAEARPTAHLCASHTPTRPSRLPARLSLSRLLRSVPCAATSELGCRKPGGAHGPSCCRPYPRADPREPTSPGPDSCGWVMRRWMGLECRPQTPG